MKREELAIGNLYSDNDGIQYGIYKGTYGAGTLSEFEKIDFDDDGAIATGEKIILTEQELKHWTEY